MSYSGKTMNPIAVALKGKGPHLFSRRVASIVRTYGHSAGRMERALQQFTAVLGQFGCSATFPVVSVVLGRNARVIQRYQDQGMEFAIHGYRHIDHHTLSREEQLEDVTSALLMFNRLGVTARGFRGPYLHANADTLLALQQAGLMYDSSLSLSWEVLQNRATPAYKHALDFYGALSADEYPSLPSFEGELVRIPYSLPDDEALVHRVSPGTAKQMRESWLAILCRSYDLGELFVLGLHPERIAHSEGPLVAVLSQACQLSPAVWIARLDEVTAWWKARTEAAVEIVDVAQGRFEVTVAGPEGTTILTRGLEVEAQAAPWSDGYQRVDGTAVTVRSPVRPFIGLSPQADPKLSSFVQQQGYISETSEQAQNYECYLNQTHFAAEDQRPLLARIENTVRTIVRLGRWPAGARSAMAISGDIDALTIWDYGLRPFGR